MNSEITLGDNTYQCHFFPAKTARKLQLLLARTAAPMILAAQGTGDVATALAGCDEQTMERLFDAVKGVTEAKTPTGTVKLVGDAWEAHFNGKPSTHQWKVLLFVLKYNFEDFFAELSAALGLKLGKGGQSPITSTG